MNGEMPRNHKEMLQLLNESGYKIVRKNFHDQIFEKKKALLLQYVPVTENNFAICNCDEDNKIAAEFMGMRIDDSVIRCKIFFCDRCKTLYIEDHLLYIEQEDARKGKRVFDMASRKGKLARLDELVDLSIRGASSVDNEICNLVDDLGLTYTEVGK